jgi:hypothetical protein
MTKRKQMTVFVPAILVLLPTAVLLKARTSFAQIVAADCITNPGSATPHGSHWYFRVDRMLHRRCWYLGPKGERLQAGAPRADVPMRLPPPRPMSLSTEPLLATGNATTVAAQMTANKNDVGPNSILRWRRSTSRALTSELGFESHNVAIGNIDAEERRTTSAQDDMPLVWPVLTPADVAAIDPQIITPKSMLLILAGAFACATMMARSVFKWSGASLAGRFGLRDRRRATRALRRAPEQIPAPGTNRSASGHLVDFVRSSHGVARRYAPSRDSDRATDARIVHRRVAGML